MDEPATLSMGIVQYNKEETVEHLINRADEMLYEAKNNGKNIVCFDNKE